MLTMIGPPNSKILKTIRLPEEVMKDNEKLHIFFRSGTIYFLGTPGDFKAYPRTLKVLKENGIPFEVLYPKTLLDMEKEE